MKTRVFGMIGVLGVALTVAMQMLTAPACKAQAEVNPDHFDGTDPWAGPLQVAQPAKPAPSVANAMVRTESSGALVVNVPFTFTAGKATLPAGEYRVEKSRTDSVMLIRRAGQKAAAFVTSVPVVATAEQAESKLIFHRNGKRYFLSQLWMAGHAGGRELALSAKEKEEALRARIETPDQVTIIARLIPSQP